MLALSVSRDRRDPHLFQGKAKHRGAVSPGVGAEAGHGSRAPCHAWVFTAPAFISLDTCTCRRSCPQGLKVLGASDFGGIGMLCRKECKLPSIRADMLELSQSQNRLVDALVPPSDADRCGDSTESRLWVAALCSVVLPPGGMSCGF